MNKDASSDRDRGSSRRCCGAASPDRTARSVRSAPVIDGGVHRRRAACRCRRRSASASPPATTSGRRARPPAATMRGQRSRTCARASAILDGDQGASPVAAASTRARPPCGDRDRARCTGSDSPARAAGGRAPELHAAPCAAAAPAPAPRWLAGPRAPSISTRTWLEPASMSQTAPDSRGAHLPSSAAPGRAWAGDRGPRPAPGSGTIFTWERHRRRREPAPRPRRESPAAAAPILTSGDKGRPA